MFSVFSLFLFIIYLFGAPDRGGKEGLLNWSGIDMRKFDCELDPCYIYKPIPFCLVDTDKTRYKFKISSLEFAQFKEEYKHLLNWELGPNSECGMLGSDKEKYSQVPYYYWTTYKYSSSRRIWIFYVPSLDELKFVVFNH